MALDTAERLYLDRQVTLARAIFVALALVDLIEMSGAGSRTAAAIFLAVYLLLALAVLLYERLSSEMSFTIPLVADFVALAVFLFLTPSVSAWWFLFLFVVFALATQGNTHLMLGLVTVATAGIIFRVAMMELSGWGGAWHWLTIGLGTVISGLGMGFLGAREREHLERQQFLEKVSRLLQFDRGLTESVRQALGEIVPKVNGSADDMKFLARSIVLLWYLGAWYKPDDLKNKVDRPQVVSPKAYTQGLVWQIAGAHPMGYSNLQFGYWSRLPNDPSRPILFDPAKT